MSGLIFYRTANLEEISSFYEKEIGMELWLDQGGCKIYQHGNMLLGFCQREETETDGIITFFYDTRKEVDKMYNNLKELDKTELRYNPEYDIYHFFSRDPDGRMIEFQHFESRMKEHSTGSYNLMHRRSIRNFTKEVPPKELLNEVFEICRYSPTSMNRQQYYYVVTDNISKIKQLAKVREGASSPLAEAPIVVAVCCTDKTKRVQQDADIAATYLLLAAYAKGLATCWITDMNRFEVKELLDIPEGDYITCLTPLGFAESQKTLPHRREVEEFVKFV